MDDRSTQNNQKNDRVTDHENDFTADHSADHTADHGNGYSADSLSGYADDQNNHQSANHHDQKNDRLKNLLGRCVHRDQVAFKQLYDSTSAQLYATLRHMLRIEAVAEEALQETYVKIWDKASEYKPDLGQPLTWMTSIARYHALDIMRKRRIRENKEIAWDEDLPGVESVVSEPGPAKTTEYQDILERCFGRLSQSQRECITRAYLEGLTHDELSASVDSPVGTVKSWIRRGLITLKECVRELS